MKKKALAKRIARLEAEVRELRDREEIRTLRCLYHEYINERRYARIPELFTPDAELDFGYLGKTQGRAKITRFFAAADSLLEFVKQFIHSHVIEIDGDRGSGWSYLEAKSISRGDAYFVAGRYDDMYLRVDGQWRFSRMNFEPYFTVPYKDPEGWAQPNRLKMGARD